jgi:hypothetical protein
MSKFNKIKYMFCINTRNSYKLINTHLLDPIDWDAVGVADEPIPPDHRSDDAAITE